MLIDYSETATGSSSYGNPATYTFKYSPVLGTSISFKYDTVQTASPYTRIGHTAKLTAGTPKTISSEYNLSYDGDRTISCTNASTQTAIAFKSVTYVIDKDVYGVAGDKSLVELYKPQIITEELDIDWLDMESCTIPANRWVVFTRLNTLPDNAVSFAYFNFVDENGYQYVPHDKNLYIAPQVFTYGTSSAPGYEDANHIEAIAVYNYTTSPVTIYGIKMFYNRLVSR